MKNKSDKSSLLARVRAVSHLLDNAIPIPGTHQRIGLDPILGLLPGGGDTLSAILSVYIVFEGIRAGLPKESLSRMVMNLVTDTVVGAFPVLGDLFDFGWKANARNLQLIEAHLNNPVPQKAADRAFVVLIVIVLCLLVVAAIALTAFTANLLWQLFSYLSG